MIDGIPVLHRRRAPLFAKLQGCSMAFDVTLPPNSTGTGVDTVSGTAGKARQVAVLGDAVTPANLLVISSIGAATMQGAAAAGAAVAGNPVQLGGSDGTNAVRLNAAGAAILAALSSAGALLATRPGDWAINHTPGAAAQATASRAAGAAGVRHVATSVSATLVTVGTAQTVITINLRDGATGAGTILWSKSIILPVNSVWEVNLSGLNIVGSAATAMTLEFSAAGAAATLESVCLTGYDTPAA